MGCGGLQGVFRGAFSEGLKILRQHERILMVFLETMLKDPVMDWTSERSRRAFHQNLELSLQLRLLLHRLEAEVIEDYITTLHNIKETSHQFLCAVAACRRLLNEQHVLQQKESEIGNLLAAEMSEEDKCRSEIQKQEILSHEHRQSILEAHETLEQILKLTQNWCYRHGHLLLVLFFQSEELLLLSKDQWNSACAPYRMDFVTPAVQDSILGHLFGEHSPATLLPKEIIEECLAVDQQRAMMDQVREIQFVAMLDAMYTYVRIVRVLFSVEYLRSSHHFKWMIAFERALSPTTHTSEDQITLCLPQQDVQEMYGTLSTAYRCVQERIESMLGKTEPEILPRLKKEAVSKSAPVQSGMAAGWKRDAFERIFHGVCQRFLDLLTSEARSSWTVSDWVEHVAGLAQVFTLFHRSHSHHVCLGIETAQEMPLLWILGVLNESVG